MSDLYRVRRGPKTHCDLCGKYIRPLDRCYFLAGIPPHTHLAVYCRVHSVGCTYKPVVIEGRAGGGR